MVNWAGGAGGAMSGAQMGSALGPFGAAAGGIIGGISGLFGGGQSAAEKQALANSQAQMERSNQFWKQAQGNLGMVRNWAAPILGGSRSAAMEAMAPEIQGATQRMDTGRQSLLNLGGRSGGAAAMIDPYAKGMVASSILQKARPQAAQAMADIGKTQGSWAGQEGGANADLWKNAQNDYERQKAQGRAFYDQLNGFSDWAKNNEGVQGFSNSMNSTIGGVLNKAGGWLPFTGKSKTSAAGGSTGNPSGWASGAV